MATAAEYLTIGSAGPAPQYALWLSVAAVIPGLQTPEQLQVRPRPGYTARSSVIRLPWLASLRGRLLR